MDSYGTFSTLHSAYCDEWLSIAFLPHVKPTFNTENNFYDLSALNLTKVNVQILPVAEALLTMDRQYQNMKFALERALSDTTTTDTERLMLIETHQTSFSAFIEKERQLLERSICDIGGRPPVFNQNQLVNGEERDLVVGARRTTTAVVGRTRFRQDGTVLGPISLLWIEFMALLAKIEDASERTFYYESTVDNIAYTIVEWRIMLANSQKIINEDKKVKKVNVYDHQSSSFVSSPINTAAAQASSHHPGASSTPSDSLFAGIDIDLSSISHHHSSHHPQQSSSLSKHSPPKHPLPPVPSPVTVSPSSSSLSLSSTDNQESSNELPQPPQHQWQQPESRERVQSVGWHKAVAPSKSVNSSSNSSSNTTGNNDNRQSVVGQDSIKGNNNTVSSNNSNSSGTNSGTTTGATVTGFNPLEAMIKGVPSGGIIKQGWMRKQGIKVKSWKRRYFILDKRKTMLYYDYHPSEQQSQQHHHHHNAQQHQQQHISAPQMTTVIDTSVEPLDKYSDHCHYEQLKYKGSIDLHTAIPVAIKPNNCNIKLNFDHGNANSGGGRTPAANSGKEEKSTEGYFGIDIHTPKRVWHLACDSSKTMDEWLLALKSTLK
ncbi:hypothetical protein SAMD00019534_113280 [Acytostelium subglobosum LB1]|uniref:hypothetical protein n=1 Tax=Acytostelium subglobosum LB1 TaxID=1410327 RepID=UPI00064489F8|nr:hypothetical protein SAMD00019534_113280 [Acytostelium subglobosum LB1]GAM28152.1 hypothetical protein SAMD00019534_113280 [Acytostelium subglobosum LB1]|eukprot:XP_012748786.1 hypothetical protein SAMD00019534_113280 [Acytostelium subglobosum LB1]